MSDWMTWEQAQVEAKAGREVVLLFDVYGTERWIYPSRLRGAAVIESGATLTATPANWEHLPLHVVPIQGVVEQGEGNEEEKIRAVIRIDGDLSLSCIARGVRLKTSIEAIADPESCRCSVCGAPWFDINAQCLHVPGAMYGGSMCYVDAYSATGDGVALTPSPAFRNSRIVGSADHNFGGLSIEQWMEPARLRASNERS